MRLAQQLTREEATSVFTRSGELQPEVIAQSRESISGTQLGNKQLVSKLTSNGSDVAEWGKYTTPTFRSPAPPNGQLRLSTRDSDVDPVLEASSPGS
jgi:hypothetical protein